MDDDFGGYDDFDEFNDWDATQCADGDYNAFEDEQVFQDGVADREAAHREEMRLRLVDYLKANFEGATASDADEIMIILDDMIYP